MAKLIYGMMQSLDGYIAGLERGPQLPMPGEDLHQYFNDHVRGLDAVIYGRRMYEIMAYWDEEHPGAPPVELDFAAAWVGTPKWVVSRTLKTLGPNASLLDGDLGAAVRHLKAATDGMLEVAGPELAASLSSLGLIDEYRLFLMPVVLGGGKPFFAAGARPELELIGTEQLPDQVILARYRPR